MTKRVYVESVKLWAIKLGIPLGSIGTMIGLVFLYLSMSGAITITGHSGDSVCAGTLEDPCIAYINLTANEDIFLYPFENADPWGRNTIMEFSPGVKDWKLQRSWGNGWRDIPLNETCTGKWCGAPNNLGVKYSYVLRKDRNYRFRIVAYKENPYDTIKWAVNYDDREYLDPVWKGVKDLYSEKTKTGSVKFNNQNEMTSEFLDNSFFKMKFNNQDKTSNKEGDKLSTESDKIKTEFYKIEKNQIDTNSIRYINRSVINATEVMTSYAMFEYSENSVSTISSYVPDTGYFFVGTSNYFNDLKSNKDNQIVRYKTLDSASCPVIIGNQNAFIIEFHKEGLTENDVDIFYSAIQRAVNDYGITKIKASDFYATNHMIYYMDGLQVKQIGRLARNGDTIMFFLYVNENNESMFDDLTLKAKLSQNFITKLGSLQDLNENINFSIKEKIVEYFMEESGYTYYVDNFTKEEEEIKSLLSIEMNKDSWLIDAEWGSPYIEKEKESYEYAVILKEKPETNIVEFDIETEGLNFYWQPELSEQDKLNGEFRPSNVENSYAVYYDGKKNNQYKTGKVMHIYRPKIIDNENNWQWADLNIDEVNGKLTITINQSFLDNATYPVLVDPTLGYTTAGASSGEANIQNSAIAGSVFAGVNGEVTSLTAYCYKKDTEDIYFKGAIYNNATGNLITNGETETISDTTSAERIWRIMNFSANPTISSGTDYIFVLTADDIGAGDDSRKEGLDYDIIDADLTGIINSTTGGNYTTNGFPSNLLFTRNTKTYSIYVNYTISGEDTTSPTYSNNAHNSTTAGTSVKFSIQYDDDTALHPNGQYIFSTNNTGTWVNESLVNFTATPSWANVTKTLNSTEGLSIGYRWYADDNLGNINNTGIFTLTTTELSLDLEVIYPTTNINVTQNEFFNVTLNVTCRGGNCGEINVSLDPYEVGDWEKDGDLVYFEDTNAYLSAEPHTLSSSDWVYFNVTPHLFSGNVNAVWGVDNSNGVKFTSPQLFKPHYVNWTTDHSQFFANVSNIDIIDGTCDYGNSYNPIKVNITYQICGEWNDSEMGCLFYNTTYSLACLDSYTHDEDDYTIYWQTNHSRLENWLDISDKFDKINYDYDGFDTWYRLQDVNVNAGQNYQIRAYLDMPISLSGANGKYGWAVYRSSDTISQAIANEHFYYLDPWFNSSWTYKKNITINHSKVNGSQVNFPVLINITDTDLRDDAQADGDDIVFTNSTGSQLDHEIEFYNGTTGFLVAWVRIPTLSNTTNTTIQMYYGNAGASNQENATGVWDDNFVMVQHMQETPTASINDSTSNDNDGTTSGMDSADQVAGQIDGSLDFDGGDDYVQVSDSTSLNITNAITIEGWIDRSVQDVYHRLFSKGSDGTPKSRYDIYIGGAGAINNDLTFDFYSGGVLQSIYGPDVLTGMTHIAITYDQTNVIFYVNNVATSIEQSGAIDSTTGNNLYIGTYLDGTTHPFNGIIDEVRISNVARSAGWIATEYNNQYSPDSFYSVGGEEEEPTDEAKGLVNDTIGATPFYTNQSNPRNISLNQDESQLVTFWVNATGTVDVTHVFYAYVNLTSNMSVNNITSEWNVTIDSEAPPADTCTYTSGNWNVDCDDNCSISSNVNLGGNNLSLSGVGIFNIQANITNFDKIFKPNNCRINIFSSGGFNK